MTFYIPPMSDFESAIEQHCAGLTHISSGIIARCEQCQRDCDATCKQLAAMSDGERELWEEPGFYKSGCETCGTTLHGMRQTGHAIADGEIIHLSMCEDCVQWFANGIHPPIVED